MSWRPKILQISDVVLRVPPLFVMDAVLNQTFIVPWIPDDVTPFGLAFFAWIFLITLCFVGAVVMFLLPTKQMIDTYSFMLCGCMLWFSYWFNMNYILTEIDTMREPYDEQFLDVFLQNPQALLFNAGAQILLAFIYNSLRMDLFARNNLHLNWSHGIVALLQSFKGGTYLCLLQPIILRLLSVPASFLKRSPLLAVLFIATELKINLLIQLREVGLWFKRVYLTTTYVLRTYGAQAFAESQWSRLHVPSVLRTFWLTRLAYHVTYWAVFTVVANWDDPSRESYLEWDDCLHIARTVLVSGCETLIALLGMTSVIAYITHYVGMGFALFIGSDNDEDRNMGTVSAVLFFILALQTGLTGLAPEKRLVRLYRNACLLSTAILHFVHSMVSPLLMNLSAAHTPAPWRHARALITCATLVAFPAWFLNYLWRNHSLSTWLLAVTAFSVEVVIKVIITLLQYTLFMVDACHEGFWEKLDDYIYYIKSTGNTVEFLFGIFLFCNGAWIMVFESGGTIRAVMMGIHAYFNIWVQAKEGWKVFMKRRTAVNKINSLPAASAEQIDTHNDVCAICYQELRTARITPCQHYFHGVCLRKWLYVQDRCPLCHKLIYQDENSAAGSEGGEVQNNNVQDNPENNAVNGQLLHQD